MDSAFSHSPWGRTSKRMCVCVGRGGRWGGAGVGGGVASCHFLVLRSSSAPCRCDTAASWKSRDFLSRISQTLTSTGEVAAAHPPTRTGGEGFDMMGEGGKMRKNIYWLIHRHPLLPLPPPAGTGEPRLLESSVSFLPFLSPSLRLSASSPLLALADP